MQFPTLALLSTLLPLASAMVLPRAASPHTFKLIPTSTDTAIAGKPLAWDTTTNSENGLGPLGWPANNAQTVTAFVQFDATTGIVFDSTNTARTFYLRGNKEAILGNPSVDPSTESKEENKWIIESDKFGWDGKFDQWYACKDADYKLFWGKSEEGCTDNFELTVEWTN